MSRYKALPCTSPLPALRARSVRATCGARRSTVLASTRGSGRVPGGTPWGEGTYAQADQSATPGPERSPCRVPHFRLDLGRALAPALALASGQARFCFPEAGTAS